MGGAGKSDASREPGTALGRPAGDRGDRGAPQGFAGAACRRRGDCGRARRDDTAGYSRRGRDHTQDRGRRAADRTGRPASGGWSRPRGPGALRVGWTNAGGCATPSAGRSTPPAGWNGPGAWSLRLQAPIPSPPGSRQPTPKTSSPSTLCAAVVRISTLFEERQHRNLPPHVSTPTLMALTRHRDYRTTRRYVQVDGKHLRDAVECLNPEASATTGATELLTVSQLLNSIVPADKVE